MKVPYVRPSLPSAEELMPDLERILESGQLTKGPFLKAYEEVLCERLGVSHVVGTSSCTVGLALAYKALRLEGPVIVPSYTFMATVNALVWAGGTPLFVDVDPETWTLSPEAVDAALTPQVRAIVGVPTFGAPCDVTGLQEIADRAGIPLVFDSAHGVGSSYQGYPLGRFGTVEAFSTTPTKTLVTGEGGFLTTNDDELAGLLRILVEYGNDGSFDTVLPGLNGRLPELSAAIGLRMLERLDDLLAKRHSIADTYRQELAGEGLRLQRIPDGYVSSYKDFTVMVEDGAPLTRDALAHELARRGIDTKKYFYPAVHRQRPYRDMGYVGRLPVTERLERQALSLPLWSAMTEDEIEHVTSSVKAALA